MQIKPLEQLSIFDIMPMSFPDINEIPEAEAARLVGSRIGVSFRYNERFRQWEGKRGKLRLSLNYDHYNKLDSNALFLGVGYEFGTSGGGAPCDTIEQAVRYFENKLSGISDRSKGA